MIACPRCGKTDCFVNHTATKAGTPRLRCKECKKAFVVEQDKKKSVEIPPCPKCNSNVKVVKYGFTKDKAQQRYICKNSSCNNVAFMKSVDYIPRRKYDIKAVINTWITISDNNYWRQLKSTFDEERKNDTKYDYIARSYNISKRTVARITSEYLDQHSEYDKNVIIAINQRIAKRNYLANNRTLTNSTKDIPLSVTSGEDK